MNFEQKLYKDLMSLTQMNEAFFFKDFVLDNDTYRIFNYRLASWTLFQTPNALNCRGTMFNVTNEPVLVSLPPEKFFNYEEGGVDHTLGKIGAKMTKMDGSLISTYLHEGNLFLKTKGSLFSSQAYSAMKMLESDGVLKFALTKLAKLGYTANLEYTSPENRVVVPYQNEDLTLLSLRFNSNGQTIHSEKLKDFLSNDCFDSLKNYLVDYSYVDPQIEQNQFVEEIRNETDGEGYVVEILTSNGDSYLTKIKNVKYITLHQTKDTVNSSKALFEAIIEESSDDLRSMFHDDPYVLDKIANMEAKVQPIFNHIVSSVENFHNANKELDRKSYAIKAQEEEKLIMPLLMNIYVGKKIDYKDFAKKHRKDIFGIDDNVVSEEDSVVQSLTP